ncbi:NGK_0946 family protein [Glaesserella sp.]|uniref:NGK_0946 family protein n=1 Tax=Glaesserella sp. TaxID=2094731 RepID=UPI00359F3264
MKKLLCVLGVATMLTACASTGDINASRGLNSSRVTQAELDQYNKQRANEVTEAQAQAAKAQGYSETIRQGSSAIQSGVDAIHSIMSIFR